MNTSKQINAMVILLALLLVAVGAYTIYDPFRADAETERTRAFLAQRASITFAQSCRECHGNQGEGRIGPALNPANRRAAGLVDFTNPDRRKEFEVLVRNTLTCGRIGTIMPPWAVEQGGALNDERIRQLVVLLTENPGGDAWEKVAEQSAEANALATPRPVQEITAGSSITGANGPVCGQRAPGTPEATPTPPPVAASWTEVATDNRFSVTAMTVAANQPVSVTLTNNGAAVHNWAVQGVKNAAGQDIQTQLLSGGQSETVRFTITQPGAYRYLCTVHPNDMRGVLFVQ